MRDAIEMAINKQELVSKVWDGLAVHGAGLPAARLPAVVWTPPASGALTYDPAKANQLLTAAGYKMGPNGIRIDPKTHKPLDLRLGIHSDESSDAAMAPYIVEWLKAIGIGVNVHSMSFNQLNADLPKGDWDMLSDSWSTGPDPTYLLSIQTCGDLPLNNGTRRATPTRSSATRPTTSSYAQQATEFSTAQRVQTIDQMQQILYQNAVDVILYYPDFLSAVRTDGVKNFFFGKPNAQGFYPQQNLFINWRTATPVASDASSSSSAALWIVIAIVVVRAARRRPDLLRPAAQDRGRAGVAGLEQYLRTALGPEPERAGGPAVRRGLQRRGTSPATSPASSPRPWSASRPAGASASSSSA